MTIIGGKATAGSTINIQFQNGAQIRRNSEMDMFNSIITGYPNGIYIDGGLPSGGTSPGTLGSVFKAQTANGALVQVKKNIIAGVENWGGSGWGSASNSTEVANVTVPAGVTYPYIITNPGKTPTTGDYDHPAPPRGRIIAVGTGSFSNGAFGYLAASGANAAGGPITIDGLAPSAWLKANNDVIVRWQESGINANIFEPLLGAPTLIPAASSLLTSGADFSGLSGFTTVTYRGAFGTEDWTTGWANWNPQQTDYSK
jgi:hypothetical protein